MHTLHWFELCVLHRSTFGVWYISNAKKFATYVFIVEKLQGVCISVSRNIFRFTMIKTYSGSCKTSNAKVQVICLTQASICDIFWMDKKRVLCRETWHICHLHHHCLLLYGRTLTHQTAIVPLLINMQGICGKTTICTTLVEYKCQQS